MPLNWQAFRLGKGGNAEADYEDASAGDPARGRFAVADGASEASFAGVWAQLLVDHFVADAGKPWRGLDWLEPARQQWATAVDSLPLPWYAEEKRELGAFATFLGLATRARADGSGGIWRALAVGDACLFHIGAGEVERAFPMTQAADFGNQPRLLRSRRPGSPTAEVGHQKAHGRWQPQDRFLLMTDALAQWFLHQLEQGGDPLAEINDLLQESSPDVSFPHWVETRRRQSLLRNDDVTLIVVDIDLR